MVVRAKCADWACMLVYAKGKRCPVCCSVCLLTLGGEGRRRVLSFILECTGEGSVHTGVY